MLIAIHGPLYDPFSASSPPLGGHFSRVYINPSPSCQNQK